jgi:hypothetical protein
MPVRQVEFSSVLRLGQVDRAGPAEPHSHAKKDRRRTRLQPRSNWSAS